MLNSRRLLPILAVITTLSILGYYLTLSNLHVSPLQSVLWLTSTEDAAPLEEIPLDDPHPIIDLLKKADAEFEQLLRKETYDVASAAWVYREKRGRHPPPGFDKWYQYALDNNVVIIEEFWDQIYHDLTPLWALNQTQMRQDIKSHQEIIKVRNGKAKCNSDHFWAEIWKDLVGSVAHHLPDLDMAINLMDEPRLLIPWEEMNKYVEAEDKSRRVLPAGSVSPEYSGISKQDDAEDAPDNFNWNSSWPIFDRVSLSCPPDSPARTAPLQTDFSDPPLLSTKFMVPHTQGGYVSNYTLSTTVCHQPDLQGLHGFFIEPISIKTSSHLFPLFGGSKLTVNSEILIPATMYYKGDSRFSSKAPIRPWNQKSDTLLWRGLASGGRNKEDNWKGFHRHRLVSMLNGTQALQMPDNSGFIDVQNLPLEMWDLKAWNESLGTRSEAIGEWLNSFSRVGFTDLSCFPAEEGSGCSYTDHLFKPLPRVSLEEQHGHKFLVDVDGNSFSGRYRDFLLSGSLPIKATLFKEWHDSRLIPWKHFVPFDNRFLDLYGIMEFFLGYAGGSENEKQGRDGSARRIAREGHEWAKRVLRKEDMRVYMFRLLLEYARVMDDKRDTLGWVRDLHD